MCVSPLKGFREKLHGHNYRLAVTITGQVGPDGYVLDFGEIKKISRVICKDLNESFLVPMNSDALKVRGRKVTAIAGVAEYVWCFLLRWMLIRLVVPQISFDGRNVHIITEDMAEFRFVAMCAACINVLWQ